MPFAESLVFRLFLWRCLTSRGPLRRRDRPRLLAALRNRTLTPARYRGFLIQLRHYLQPGPGLLGNAAERQAADSSFSTYLTAHAAADRVSLAALDDDLNTLPSAPDEACPAAPLPETLRLNAFVESMFVQSDPALILVSDLAAKLILADYTDKILAALHPCLSPEPAGTRFFSQAAKDHGRLARPFMQLLRCKTTSRNRRLFLVRLREVMRLFADWLDAM